MKIKDTIISLMMLLTATAVQAQISIGGSIYGGGNAGNTGGSTKVTVYEGDLHAVFAGARMANVGGSAFVHLDGKHASNYILADYVYGGNDIAGTIGTSSTLPVDENDQPILTKTAENNIDNTWNAFVRISTKTTTTGEEPNTTEEEAADAQKIYIGQLFGGGNGYYDYDSETTGEGPAAVTTYRAKDKVSGDVVASSSTSLSAPELGKAYLEILGGSIVYAYAGGNNATITGSTVVCLDNPSNVVSSIIDTNNPSANTDPDKGTVGELLTNERFKLMRVNTILSKPSSDAFQIGRMFGGNNKAEMSIRPTWNLKRGMVRNLYSGGNEGAMTHPNGLCLTIKSENMKVDNVYGGCRMADVNPANNKQAITKETIDGVSYPAKYAARVLITAGDINNVYGGNDVTGNVYGGNAVGIHCSIKGDVYGGGNGSYPYTDNAKLEGDDAYGDLYYNPATVLAKANLTATSEALKSVEALNVFRPNAEAVSIRLIGTETNPTVIGGSVYCGGNSATLRNDRDADAAAELKIGSYVYADNVFFGNNGENMIKTNEKSDTEMEGVLRTFRNPVTGSDQLFNSIDLTYKELFEAYMDGVAMRVRPRVVFDISKEKGGEDDEDYEPYSTYFGSLFGGGNIGSMKFLGKVELDFNKKIVIFDKFVGGCNNAFVPEQFATVNGVANTKLNALYEGGVLEDPESSTSNKLVLNLSGLKIQPKRWNATYTPIAANEDLVIGNKYYTSNLGDGEFIATTTEKEGGKTYYKQTSHGTELIWNTISAETGLRIPNITPGELATSVESSSVDLDRRLKGGNIYGGCYNSGIVNGNVVININETLIERDKLFDEVESDELGEEVSLYGEDQTSQTTYNITNRHTGVILGQQGMDVLGKALNVFGGGYGKDARIWGSTTVNLNKGYVFQIFGGSEQGVIGKSLEELGTTVTEDDEDKNTTKNYDYVFEDNHYAYNPAYSCYVNLKGDYDGVSKKDNSSDNMAECEFMYGGGFFGPIVGNTYVNLGKGRIFNSFAGSCNADILGHTETYIGRMIKDDYQNVMGSHVGEVDAYEAGFPWIRDYTYGGNDLGGKIMREESFVGRVRDDVKGMVHKYNATSNANPDVLKAAAYTEYLQGRAIGIFGGCYGTYDYKDRKFSDYTDENGDPKIVGGKAIFTKPRLNNAIVNFRPTYVSEKNKVDEIYGAGQGYSGEKDRDVMQNRSYVLIDIPTSFGTKYENLEVFGAGAWGGVGMDVTLGAYADKDKTSAIIDLARGTIGAAYGASYKEGVTRRTVVNVPVGSTINIGSIFGGAYGTETLLPCDVYEANVEYHSELASLIYNPVRTEKETNAETGEETTKTVGNPLMKGAIYGGNNQERRTIFGRINIDVPVKQIHHQYGTTKAYVYGAGYGPKTWSEYTEVKLVSNEERHTAAEVYEVYGGGEAGRVLNAESVQKYMNTYVSSKPQGITKPSSISDDDYNNHWDKVWKAAWTLGGGLDPENFTLTADGNSYLNNDKTNLNNARARTAEIDDRETKTYKYNTNVIIGKGANVGNYAYGGGLGKEGEGMTGSGDVYGTTYIALLGGEVNKDIYAAGTLGAVYDAFGAKNFTAGTTAYIAGGTLRNVYGGGWKGDVGYTEMAISSDEKTATFGDERPGETHVVIGIRHDQTDTNLENELKKVLGNKATKENYGLYDGQPAIQRNAYSGGEGGAVFGKAYLTLNDGYIGYGYSADSIAASSKYDLPGGYYPMIEDKTHKVQGVFVPNTRLADCGNLFGGGYDVRSSVDETYVKIWNGVVRNSVHGGGEIATIGRGAVTPSGTNNSVRTLKGFYKAGKTNIEMYNGHVQRNVFGGGKGYNIYGYGQEGTLYTDGYVFGQTEVHIHGGEIGTDKNLAQGYGNVFGGGDIGYVYSPNITSPLTQQKNSTHSPGHIYYYNNHGDLEEDCKVVIAPWLQVRAEGGATINGKTKAQYEYFETDDLNTLGKTKANGNWTGKWAQLFTGDYLNGAVNPDDPVERGIHIHNAVFGGGNVSSNSDQSYANATTVYGNTTATLYDLYHRDFITVGTEHIGGIYGGGNLSVVDGYRELNITNYGTDYYGLQQTITIDEYRGLSNRERAYFQLEYECTADTEKDDDGNEGVRINGVFYKKGSKLSEEDYLKLVNSTIEGVAAKAKSSFNPYGFCSIYAGRLLNTIQRADLCGVFGSRMVLQGAKDRVAEVGEDIDYTINRVGELSLNQQRFTPGDDSEIHGNYFGIYSLVNYLGNLTSDVHFTDPYRNKDGVEETDKTYYTYKSANHTSSDRNKGQSFNQVALASGVFLELTTEESTKEHKDYGYVTGVIELDLINVKQDQVGGGFVYAKNEHRVPTYDITIPNAILSPYNKQTGNEAVTYKRYVYEGTDFKAWQTSGNFIHHEKRIVDDCYPTNNAYVIGSANYSEAHYWYVKGDVYIYEQKVSAYTGSANAYSKEVHLPLTITAASHGQLQLLNVKPNLYAYKMPGANDGDAPVKIGSLNDTNGKPIDKVTVNNESDTYKLNDVISWWDWHQMSASDRQYFVPNTYVNCVTCQVDGVTYEAGTYVMDDTDFNAFKAYKDANNKPHQIRDASGEMFKDDDDNDIGLTYVFRSSNNISHETGYVLTFDMNSPKKWDDYYTSVNSAQKISKAEYEARLAAATTEAAKQDTINAWREGPTFTPTTSGVYGKREYKAGDVITKAAYDNAGEGKDKMKRAYVATQTVTYTYGDKQKTMNPGAAISATEWGAIGTAQSSFAEALFVTNTVRLSKDEYMLYGELKTAAQIEAIKAAIEADNTRSTADKEKLKTDIDDALTDAYILTESGTYGGQQFNAGTNYGAIEAWCSLSPEDRYDADGKPRFNYNYDALDLLVNSNYLAVNTGVTSSPTHESTVGAYHTPYTDEVKVEYQAVYVANTSQDIYYNDNTYKRFTKETSDATITNTEYETIRNDKKHYTYIETTNVDETVYITNKNFIYLGIPYGVGQVVDKDIFDANTGSVDNPTIPTPGEYYYCYEEYTKKDGTTKVSAGTLLAPTDYKNEELVPNYQQYFIIQGKEPTETTTLYVSRESNAYDVMKEKIITVVYQYTYNEDEDDGGVKKTNELHVINIHLQLESGAPIIGQLQDPPMVLPGDAVGLSRPDVNPGLYEVLNSGWELFTTPDDAANHRNGIPFENNSTLVYWYQNQKNWVAFYSRTWLGKTYSNPVPLSVANYHDLDKIMLDKKHHMYVDRSDVDRDCKIYIDNRECQSDATKSELDLLKDFFDLSVGKYNGTAVETDDNGIITTNGALKDHATLGNHIHAGRNLEFFLRSSVSPKAYVPTTANPTGTWTPIGNNSTTGDAGECFEGILHGDGYTVSGLNNSLFGHLCGEVYNLGVTGSFTGAGVADHGDGYVENCWINTTGAPDADVKAVFNGGTDGSQMDGDRKLLANCYYPNTKAYKAGLATAMPEKAFYNGTVAYNLNGFYLHKRYYQGTNLGATGNTPYKYLQPNADGTLPEDMTTGYYPNSYAIYQPDIKVEEGETKPYLGYVENRFYDGDYRYAGGSIPESNDLRMRTVTVGEGENAVTTTHFVPIWPDDYLFFGQTLTYGHVDSRAHQSYPSRIVKSNERIQTSQDGNRVYRAPAYFRSETMEVAHFNPYAVFAATQKDNENVIAYKDMTAIDFTGGNGDVAGGYKEGWTGDHFFLPLLDDDGITAFENVNLTRNLLVYSKAGTPTDGVVSALTDNAYSESNSTYRTVPRSDDPYTKSVKSHWVQLTANDVYEAQRDHFLVDKEDFNCPIAYKFKAGTGTAAGKRMWYQRDPQDMRYVDLTKGWEAISLPFSPEIVTTQDKGELTHFYQGSTAGHEYWLREFKGNVQQKQENNLPVDGVYTADFNPLAAGSNTKDYTNTFLWDYYYSKDSYLDKNQDEYHKQYYSEDYLKEKYPVTDYPYAVAGKPYITGFPGASYYEFDLSGQWEPKNRYQNGEIESKGKQTITFASAPGATIGVSDGEMADVTESGYTFKATYLNNPEIATGNDAYLLDNEGAGFKKTASADVKITAFRPYFVAPTPSSSNPAPRYITFNSMSGSIGIHDEQGEDNVAENLIIKTSRGKVIVTSQMRHETGVHIATVGGVNIAAFTIQPGETIETPVSSAGVYIVNRKKLVVR